MMIRTLTVFCFALMLISGLVYSSDMDDFTRLDVDQNGKLSETEFSKLSSDRGGQRRGGGRSGSAIDRFTNADADGDGYLSPSEFSAASGKRGSRDRA